MTKKTEQLTQEIQTLWQEVDGIRKTVVKEQREFTTEERDRVEEVLDEVRGKELEIEKLQKDASLMNQIEAMSRSMANGATGQPAGSNGSGQPAPQNGQKALGSVGAQFVNSDAWKNWLAQVAPKGHIPDSVKGLSSPPVEIRDLGLFRNRKDLITGGSSTSAGVFVVTEDSGIYEPLGRFPLTLRDLVSVRTTSSDTVEFVRQTTQVTQATPVPEANVTTYTGATGQVSGLKPEGSMAFERVSTSVKTIAVWVPATKRALADVGQLRGIIDQELRADLAEELENQMLNGDGSGENLTGLANTANTLGQMFVTDLVTTTRKAITNLLVNGKQMPTAWLFNPQDWETFDLMKDLEGRYYWGGPMAMGPRTLWGVPVAQSFHQVQGTSWLGNWSKAVLWDRQATTITVSDSHADFFIRNLIAVLGELRAAFGVIRPTAFVEVDLAGS